MAETGAIAVIADVHANRWALEAVLEDLERRDVRRIVNLGDSLYGPLDPAGTARLLRERGIESVRGNQDRTVLEAASGGDASGGDASGTLRFVRDALGRDDLAWLAAHRPTVELLGGRVLGCHGTPVRDDSYLAERVGEGGVAIREPDALAAELAGVAAEVVLCGHSHVPRLLSVPGGRWIVNPGSVGLPAYGDDLPYPHAMEAGSPHARYAILALGTRGWSVELIALAYDWERAAATADGQGRADWAAWLRTGRARAPRPAGR